VRMSNTKKESSYVTLMLVNHTGLAQMCSRLCEMGRTCGTYGGEERCIQGFSGET
jgi:hypothetical protein